MNIFMTHMTNYANDRLGQYTFESVMKYIHCWTNLQLITIPPVLMGEKYFKLYPEEIDPVWSVSRNTSEQFIFLVQGLMSLIFEIFRIHVMISGIRKYGLLQNLATVFPNFWLLGHKRREPLHYTHLLACIPRLVVVKRVQKLLKKFSSSMGRII